ncbi:LysR family transcriptional regulator [Reinekea forsetii]|nr:LysR family transcriptional regulator [Reinekea forsetii]
MDQLRALKYFVAVAQTGSFTQAAARFNVPPSSLSRRVADLEASLGATLLKRTTRVVKLTEVGRNYYLQVDAIIRALEQSDESVRSYHSEPMGRLKISSMVGFGEQVLIPLLDQFSVQYPKVILDLTLSDQLSAFDRDDVDIAIRGGYAPNERVVAVKLMQNDFYPVAAQAYLDSAGTPKHPFDLKTHRGLFFQSPTGPTPWLCFVENQWHDVSGTPVLISNSGHWLVDRAVKGEGILMLPKWVTQPYLESGALQEIHFDTPVNITQQPDFGVFLLYQKQRYLVPKIKAAVDFIVSNLKA